jgi:hypothetical protein
LTETLRVLCWLWHQERGRARYEPGHVRIWASMLRRHLTLPHSLAVVTDMAADYGEGIDVIPLPRDFEDVRIPTWGAGRPQCFRRLALFRPDAAELFGGERIVSMDLDVVITDSLDMLFTGGEDFKICRGTATTRSFNGSMYMLRAGSRPDVYNDFTPERALQAGRRHVGSDQSWLARCFAGAPTWGPEDGVVAIQQRYLAKAPRLITYPGAAKPWTIAGLGLDSVVTEHYRRAPSGTGLILGYGEAIWADVGAALEAGHRFDGVIASPETAPHWPGQVLAIADDDDHAERLATMYGFQQIIFCGRSGGRANAVVG